MSAHGSAWQVAADGLRLAVRVTPRVPGERFGPGEGDRFAARLTAPPVDGAANAALVALVARSFGVAKRDVRIIGGETSRVKRVAVAGEPMALAQIAHSLYAGGHDG